MCLFVVVVFFLVCVCVFFSVTGRISLSSHICMHVCICLFAPAWACARAYEYVCMCTRIYVMCEWGERGRRGGGGGAGVVRAFVYIHVTMDVRIY